MAIKTLRVFQEFTAEGYVPMPIAGNIDYGYTIADTFPATTPATFQTDNPDIEVEVTEMTDFYVWIRSNGTAWNKNYTRNVRVYPDSALINNVVMGIIIANLGDTVPYEGATENVDLGEFGLSAGYVGFDTTPTNTPITEGTMSWNDGDGTLDLIMKGGNVTLQLGQELLARCYNAEATTLVDGEIVYIYGAQGNRVSVKRASSSSEMGSSVTFGMVTETIASGEEGFVTVQGTVNKLNTIGLTQGSALWLGSTAGTYTQTKPIAPEHAVLIGYVERVHATVGSIYVKVQNGYELNELHNVKITSVADKDALIYNSTEELWENISLFGTQGYLPYYDDTLYLKDSPLFTDGVDVAIGTNSIVSGNKLTIDGNLWSKNITINDIAKFSTTTSPNKLSISIWNGTSWLENVTMVSNMTTINTDLTATKFIKLGATDGDILLGDGSTLLKSTIIFGSISANYVPYANGVNSLANSSIYTNGTEVAINTTTTIAGVPLRVNGTISANALWFGTNPVLRDVFGNLTLSTIGTTSDFIIQNTSGSRFATFWNDGLVTIGNVASNGVDRLQVDGSIISSAFKTVGGSTANLVQGNGALINIVDLPFAENVGGVANYVPKYSTADMISISQIFDNGTGVGINTTTITERLTINGYVQATGYKVPSGTASGFLKANGSIDTSAYITLHSLSADAPLSYNNTTGKFTISKSTAFIDGYLSAIDFDYFYNKVDGSGSINYIPKFSGSKLIGNSQIFDNGTNVVIGGTTGSSKFNVIGSSFFDGNITIAQDSNLRFVQANSINAPNQGESIIDALTTGFHYRVNVGGTNSKTFVFDTASMSIGSYYFYVLPDKQGTLALTSDIPSLAGYVPTTRTININGTSFDLSANRTWSVGTVTSVSALTIGTSGTDIGSTVATPTTTPTITLNIPTASATNRGALSSADWTTFNSKQSALTLGNLTEATSSVLTILGGTGAVIGSGASIQVKQASGSQSGFLSSTDWTTFNSKQNALTNPITGSLTANYIPKATSATTLVNSLIYDNGINVGINTTTFTYASTNRTNLALNGASSSLFEFKIADTSSAYLYNAPSSFEINVNGSRPLYLSTGGAIRATLDASGNLGLGVTPSAWGYLTAFQLGTTSISNRNDTGNTLFSSNSYYDGTNWRYIFSFQASYYQQTLGQHIWYTAPSGTAGTAITFTQAMTLNASGRLLLGQTTDNGARLQVNGNGYFSGQLFINEQSGGYVQQTFQYGGITKMSSYWENGSNSFNLITSGELRLGTNSTERMRITSAGNVGIGITNVTGGSRLEVAGNISIKAGADGYVQTTDANNIILRADQQAGTNGKGVYLQYYNASAWQNALYILNNNTITFSNLILQPSGGNVGIGTTSPSAKTQIFTDRYNDNLTFNSAAGFIIGGSIRQLSINTDDTFPYNISFQAKTNANSIANIVLQSQGGNVGIGTTSPAYRLDVAGTINGTSVRITGGLATQYLMADGSVTTGAITGSGTNGYLAKWTASNTLGQGLFYDITSATGIGTLPTTAYRFNINTSTNRYTSFWIPDIGGTSEGGMIIHDGNGLSGLRPFAISASSIYLPNSYINTNSVTGGGALQVGGDVNITGTFRVNGTAIGTGGGGVSGSGTTNYISMWSGGTSLTNSNAYITGQNNFNINVGTSNITTIRFSQYSTTEPSLWLYGYDNSLPAVYSLFKITSKNIILEVAPNNQSTSYQPIILSSSGNMYMNYNSGATLMIDAFANNTNKIVSLGVINSVDTFATVRFSDNNTNYNGIGFGYGVLSGASRGLIYGVAPNSTTQSFIHFVVSNGSGAGGGANWTNTLTIKHNTINALVPSSAIGLSSGDFYKDANGFVKIV